MTRRNKLDFFAISLHAYIYFVFLVILSPLEELGLIIFFPIEALGGAYFSLNLNKI
jgi:hypothetical protein